MTVFQKAQRHKAKVRLGLCGPSGSGKSHSALLIASGITSRKIFVIDTEKGSALLEQGKPGIPEFYHAELTPPFSPARYIEYIQTAVGEGAACIIVDSLSHAWTGTGGILDEHGRIASTKNNNQWSAWRHLTPEHNRLIDTMLNCDAHLIATMRTKTTWEVVDGDNGKKQPVKLGLKPEQREGMEYEFTVVLDLSVEGHVATSSKDRTSLFDGRHFVPSKETGTQIGKWLSQGADPARISHEMLTQYKAVVDTVEGITQLENWYRNHKDGFRALTPPHLDELLKHCASRKEALNNGAPA